MQIRIEKKTKIIINKFICETYPITSFHACTSSFLTMLTIKWRMVKIIERSLRYCSPGVHGYGNVWPMFYWVDMWNSTLVLPTYS